MPDFVLADDQNVDVALPILDRAGNATSDVFDPGSLTATGSDAGANVTVTVSADQTSMNVRAVGPLATGITITTNGTVNGNPLTGTFVVDVDADNANPASIGATPGTPVAN
jgi:outer membrane usher protein FimD/PapC